MNTRVNFSRLNRRQSPNLTSTKLQIAWCVSTRFKSSKLNRTRRRTKHKQRKPGLRWLRWTKAHSSLLNSSSLTWRNQAWNTSSKWWLMAPWEWTTVWECKTAEWWCSPTAWWCKQTHSKWCHSSQAIWICNPFLRCQLNSLQISSQLQKVSSNHKILFFTSRHRWVCDLLHWLSTLPKWPSSNR